MPTRTADDRWSMIAMRWSGCSVTAMCRLVRRATATATISAAATIDNAARELLDNDIGRLVVVDDGAVVGLLSRSDGVKLVLPHWHVTDACGPKVRRLPQMSPLIDYMADSACSTQAISAGSGGAPV